MSVTSGSKWRGGRSNKCDSEAVNEVRGRCLYSFQREQVYVEAITDTAFAITATWEGRQGTLANGADFVSRHMSVTITSKWGGSPLSGSIIPMNFNEFQWISTNVNESQWISRNTNSEVMEWGPPTLHFSAKIAPHVRNFRASRRPLGG